MKFSSFKKDEKSYAIRSKTMESKIKTIAFTSLAVLFPLLSGCGTASSSSTSTSESDKASSSQGDSSSSEPKKKNITSIQIDGAGNKPLVESLCYQQPVWGHEIAERYPGTKTDAFKPTLTYDDQGGLSFAMDVPYDSTYHWHLENNYQDIGRTMVPSAYLDNILFENPSSSSSLSSGVLPASSAKINWNPNHTINASGSFVEAGQVIDMSTQIDSVTLSTGEVLTAYSLSPNNAAFASASGKTFTILNASRNIKINIMNGTTATGFYFTVSAYSQTLGAMSRNIEATPFGTNYTAELISSADNRVLARGIHHEDYFFQENFQTGEKEGKLLFGPEKQPVGFSLDSNALLLDGFKAYPFSDYLMGGACPIDHPLNCMIDTLKDATSAAGAIIIKSALNNLIASFVLSTVGYSASQFTSSGVDCNIIAVSYLEEKNAFEFALFYHSTEPEAYQDLGLKVVLSSRGTSKNEIVDNYLANGAAPTFLEAPKSFVSAFKVLLEKKNYTIASTSTWLETATGQAVKDEAKLKEIQYASNLYSTSCFSYVDEHSYFAEDKTHKTYVGCTTVNGILYEINGAPDYTRGSVLWSKSNISSYTDSETGEKKSSSELWLNPNSQSLYTSSYVTENSLQTLNIHTIIQAS
jgi:hypothetical protein